jgi:hypothetical protein
MSLIKIALDNQREKGYDTKRIWKARGKGALVGGALGSAAFAGGPQMGLAGLGIGALYGAVLGDMSTKIKQHKEYAKRHGSNHPNWQTLNPLTSLRMLKNTPIEESLKQVDPYGALYGPLARVGKLKDQKPGKKK